MAVKITFSQIGWTSSVSAVWIDTDTKKVYSDSGLTNEISSVPIPTRTDALGYFKFTGYYSNATFSSATLYIDSDGVILSSLRDVESAKTIYCRGDRFSVKITLDKSDGAGGTDSFWRIVTPTTQDNFFVEKECINPISSISCPTRYGYAFGGYYDTPTPTSGQLIDEHGNILPSLAESRIGLTTLYAYWEIKTYTLSFDYNGGAGSVSSKEITFGSAIGELPSTSRVRADLLGWYIGNSAITPQTIWNYDSDQTAKAVWDTYFGRVVDYFNLGSSTLIPESSDSGDNKQHVCAYNAVGETPVTETSGAWRNPSVTYRVVGDMTLSLYLGDAFAASVGMSGYMITSVSISTSIGDAPTVTVTGVANEGANAVKRYPISVPISARHRPQNLMGAISSTSGQSGGDLQQLTLTAICDPVVLAENNMPCASDVCHGRIEVSATTGAFDYESEPMAGATFTQIGAPVANSGTGYKTWTVNLRKELT